ncbi:TolC family protein [Albibacterium indicum]|uniref:TolC family protein n=1 Tax=Albibacterium indicum TaxID=2292082 RepID=UPI000E4B42C5|nr:TolC family protein [Pedobacter indicus]
MRKPWNYLLILFLIISFLHTFAQKTEVKLYQVYNTALERYPGVNERVAAIHAAQLDQKLIKSKQLPQAKLQLQNSFGTLESSSGAFFPLPGMFNINGSTDSDDINTSFNMYGSVLADWEIFSFGKLNAEHQASNLKVQEAVSDLSIYELDLQSLISRLYLKILYNDVRLKWSQDNVSRINEIYKVSKVLAAAGLTPGADTALASSSYYQLLSEEDLLRGKLQASKHQLNEFLSVDLNQKDFSSHRFLTARPHKLATQNQRKHPYLDKLAHQIEYQNLQQKLAERSMLPSVSLLAGLSSRGFSHRRNDGGGWANSFDNQASNYLVGVGLTWNITGLYDKNLEKRRAAELGKMAQSSYQQQELRIDAGVRSASSQISEQIKQVAKTKLGVEKAEQAYLLYRTRYENGLINLTELLQIQLLLQLAEEKQIEAFRGLWEQVIIHSELKADFSNLFEIF